MAYDPNESRDPRGRWTSSGGEAGHLHTAAGFPSVLVDHPENAHTAKLVAEDSAKVAKKLDFPPSRIIVVDRDYAFTLNGKQLYAGGTADLSTGFITMYSGRLSAASTPGVVAHEIEHQKFQAFENDYKADRAAMEKDPAYLAGLPTWIGETRIAPTGRDIMKGDGTLHEPYASKYPVYTAYTEAMKPTISDFAKSDGVSGYSRDWWDAWHNQTANTSQAMHETLAEMARHRYEGHKVEHIVRDPKTKVLSVRHAVDPKWNALYKAVDANWKRRNAK